MPSMLPQQIHVNNQSPIVSHAIENVKTLAEARLKIEAARRDTYGLVVLFQAPAPFDTEYNELKKLCDELRMFLVIDKPKQRAAS